jgi:hypothetical protein
MPGVPQSPIAFSPRQLGQALEASVHRGELATRFQLKCLLNGEAFEIILDQKNLPFVNDYRLLV